jgi:glycosyltransferase involved in cell wall biosynthesis
MRRLLDVLQSLSCKVTFAASCPSAWPPLDERAGRDISSLRLSGIEVVEGEEIRAVEDHLLSKGKEYDAVLLSGGVYTAARHIQSVIKHAPQAIKIFDTVDLHFLREFRHARLTRSHHRLRRALVCKANEVAIARRADYTLVVSDLEKETLERECPQARVCVLSNIHEVFGCRMPFAERRDLMFVGAFQHLPNIDAVTWFVSEIFPLVKAEIAGLKIHIIGGHPPAEITDLSADDVIVTGHVADIAPYFDACRLSVAPLRFGAGVKGKALMSMSYGLPVVMTSIAAEGMHLTDGRDALVADSPAEFSRAIASLYEDEVQWAQLSRNGLEIVSRHFSFASARETLRGLLTGSV